MPQAQDLTPADRQKGVLVNMHPRLNGDVIQTPDDVLEGLGNFIGEDPDGNPTGWTIGRTPVPDGRHLYVGPTADRCTRQTGGNPLPHARPSSLVDYTIINGGPTPKADDPGLARIPKPGKVILKAKKAAGSKGYPASTPSSPHWYAWARIKEGNVGAMSPAVPFHLDTGQNFRVLLPIPDDDTDRIALLMSEPGKSRPDRPGLMFVQREISLSRNLLPYYDLSGPFRSPGRGYALGDDDTSLGRAKAPDIRIVPRGVSRVARYECRVQWCDDTGAAIPGPSSRQLFLPRSDRYVIRDDQGEVSFLAGAGRISVRRPPAPAAATGWRLWVYMRPTNDPSDFSAGWRKVMNKFSGGGQAVPFSLENNVIEFSGWDGSEAHYAANDANICVQEDLPRVNTSGTLPPDSAPEPPEPTGSGRPDPQKWFVRTTDTVDGAESVASDASSITIEDDEIFAAIFPQDDNELPNGAIVETDPEGNPLYWTVVRTGGFANQVEDTIEFGTFAPVAGAAPSVETDLAAVNPNVPLYVDTEFTVDESPSGTPSGSLTVRINYWDEGSALISTETLTSATAPGEYDRTITVNPTGGVAPAMPATCAFVSITFLFTAAAGTTNKTASVRHAGVRKDKHKRRRHRRHHHNRKPKKPRKPRNPVVEDPPDPVKGPDVVAEDAPDRPSSAGTVLENVGTSVSPPAGMTKTESGATISSTLAAGLGGDTGLDVVKNGTAAPGHAYVTKTLTPTKPAYPFRHEHGTFTLNRLPVLPTSGRLVLHPILSNGVKKIWAELSVAQEQDTLTITDNALQAGTAYVSLNGVEFPVNVPGVAEVKDVTVGANPTAAGDVSVTLDGIKTSFAQGNTAQSFTLLITSRAEHNGKIILGVNGVSYSISVSQTWDKARIATTIRAQGFPGYTVEYVAGRTDQLRFTANNPGTRPAPTFAHNGTRVSATLATQVVGTNETKEELASRIRSATYVGWAASTGAFANVVRFTATSVGNRIAALVSSGTTGAALTVSDVTQGSVSDKNALAAAIRGIVATGWTNSGTGAVAIFTATTTGPRTPPQYRPNNTGAAGTFDRTIVGASAAVTAHAEDKDGNRIQKKILDNLLTTDIVRLDITVSGAGTDRAVATFWACKGLNSTMLHCARFEDLDLDLNPITSTRLGVAEQVGSNSAYQLQIDNPQFTDRGKTYYRDHDALGAWLPQIFSYTHKTQPIRQDLLLQDMEFAVIPGQQYALSLYARATIIEAEIPARLLTAHAHRPGPDHRGLKQYMGDVSGDTTELTGLTGTNPWAQRTITYVAPLDCHKISVSSRDIGAAEIVLQEVVNSPGPLPKRTLLYAPSGSYTSTFDTRTPGSRNATNFWTRRRKAINALCDTADNGCAVTVTYSSAPASAANPELPGIFSAAVSDPETVPDRAFFRTIFQASSGGLVTAAVKSGVPKVEYALYAGVRPMSTLLDHHGRELPGGTAFARLNEWSRRRPEGRKRLPSGRLYDAPSLFEPVGHLPACEVLVFSYAAKRYIEENWREHFRHEHFGLDLLTLKLSEQPEFERETVTVETDGKRGRYAVWKAKLAPCQVLSAVRMA